MLKRIINKEEDNLIFTKFANKVNHIDFKDIIYNFLNQPQIKVEQKYDLLFSNAIKRNCFKEVVKNLEQDFKNNFILWKLTERISNLTNKFFSSHFRKGEGFKIIQRLFLLKQIFLAQLRYNSNIWLKLDVNQSQRVLDKKNDLNINYKIALMLFDFNDNDDLSNLINGDQKLILDLVLRSNSIEEFVTLNNEIEVDIFKYLPINMMLLQAQMIKSNSKLNLKEKAKLSYSTFMQLFCIFVEENLSKKKLN
ncbi:hypothetical protein [Spiroplasma monobiae]|uniref:Uncharacterized protein n=1 Tax=Spiroplasma monobiae MQ-1 TaxID=1336748 RepID=A0A2K9LXT8_SPISQ|nr:hypothetical protein [Spiroplasma monobiae]AUM62534.1 hypothetical protein SMONO_v1c02850 [Spiroplasma monobiae MQ-1]